MNLRIQDAMIEVGQKALEFGSDQTFRELCLLVFLEADCPRESGIAKETANRISKVLSNGFQR